MKVFLSWHGETSLKVAQAFRDWLPKVINMVKPFVSDNIPKGERWIDHLTTELKESKFGIIFVTKRSINKPWVNFEAGAISTAFDDKTAVCPFLFRFKSSEIDGPLSQFQATVNKEEDILKLVKNINQNLEDDLRMGTELLEEIFQKWWPDLEKVLKDISDIDYDTSTPYNWLYSEEDLIRKQNTTAFEQIWIITQELFKRALAKNIKALIERNIKKDIVYKFFIPLNQQLGEYREDVENLFKEKPENITLVPIEEEEFKLLSATDFIFLFPKKDDQTPSHGFLELPLEKEHKYWIEVDAHAAVKYVNRFKYIEEKLKKGKKSKPK